MFERVLELVARRLFCPVCSKRIKRFLPLPAEYEANARRYGYPHFGKGETINIAHYSCPRCGASDRERLYALYLGQRAVSQTPGLPPRLLHFAPEPALSEYLRRLGAFDYRTTDIKGDGVDDRADITQMGLYPDATFDAFLCSHVLEHVSDDAAALRELYRILKPGGWGVLMVPLIPYLDATLEIPAATEAERWRLFGQGDHVRLYAKGDFLHRISQVGFRVEQLGVDHFGRKVFERCGIAIGSILYVVSHD